jgi:two-component system cell cycle sensor histidine kinase/response regulator CckA
MLAIEKAGSSSRDPIRSYLYVLPACFLVLVIVMGIVGYRYYIDQKADIEAEVRNRLETIARLKVQEVTSWREERLSDARTAAATAAMPALRNTLLEHASASDRQQALAWLETVRTSGRYANAILVDLHGRTVLAAGRTTAKSYPHYAELARRVVEGGEVGITDLHYDEGLGGPHMGLSAPLRFSLDGPVEGALLLGIDPRDFLYPLIQEWPTPSATAETLLARREGNEVVFLNTLRHRRGAALKVRLPLNNPEIPAIKGALGFEGVTEGNDYRGVPVLASVHKVPDSPWILVAKEDAAEVYAPIRGQVFWLVLIGCSLAVAIAAGGVMLWRGVRLRFYRQRYEAEIQRQALVGHYDYLSRFANDIIFLTDEEGRIAEVNDRAVAAYGYTRQELIGMPERELRDIPARETYEADRQALDRQNSLVFETTHRRKDGSIFPVEVSARRIAVDRGVFRQSIIRDITERRQAEAERSRLREQLLQAQKMESIGRLAGGVAHDFNNLLTVINGYASFALEELYRGHPLHGTISEIAAAGERAAALTQQLLAFSRKQVAAPKVIDLNETIADIAKMLRRIVGEEIEVTASFSSAPALVLADRGQIQQILVNLATNAKDAMPGGGKLAIETTIVGLDGMHPGQSAEAKPGPHVLLAVTDTGSGMDEETRQHIFEPFFTTKPAGRGTGLGLSTVYGIVRQSKGWIAVYSEPGKGTTFRIYLPLVAGAAEPHASSPSGSSESLGGKETVLVVEDQAEVRKLVLDVLRTYGYRVLEASNGGEALELAHCLSEPIDLLITDVMMPGMTGRDLAARFAPLRPGMKVLYMSGYSDNVLATESVLQPGLNYLGKPFSMIALARKVREVLGGKAL